MDQLELAANTYRRHEAEVNERAAAAYAVAYLAAGGDSDGKDVRDDVQTAAIAAGNAAYQAVLDGDEELKRLSEALACEIDYSTQE